VPVFLGGGGARSRFLHCMYKIWCLAYSILYMENSYNWLVCMAIVHGCSMLSGGVVGGGYLPVHCPQWREAFSWWGLFCWLLLKTGGLHYTLISHHYHCSCLVCASWMLAPMYSTVIECTLCGTIIVPLCDTIIVHLCGTIIVPHSVVGNAAKT
jgi:hypothetical protein